MNDRRTRLVEDLPARGADGEREIGIFVIGGRIARIEAAERFPHTARNREARAGAIVDFAQVIELGSVGIVAAAHVPRTAVTPDDAAGFLQPAIGVHELGADEPRLRMAREHRLQRGEPAGGDDRIVVEEHERVSACKRRAATAGAEAPEVRGVALETNAGHLRELSLIHISEPTRLLSISYA